FAEEEIETFVAQNLAHVDPRLIEYRAHLGGAYRIAPASKKVAGTPWRNRGFAILTASDTGRPASAILLCSHARNSSHGCRCEDHREKSTMSTDRFQLAILRSAWGELKLGYDYSGAFPALRAARATDTLFTVGVDQIETYDWNAQAITLTPEATAN